MDVKKGDLKYYRSPSEVYKVEVVDAQEKALAIFLGNRGEQYHLRILEVIDTSAHIHQPMEGLEFTVWKAAGSNLYVGWHLLDT